MLSKKLPTNVIRPLLHINLGVSKCSFFSDEQYYHNKKQEKINEPLELERKKGTKKHIKRNITKKIKKKLNNINNNIIKKND